MVWDTLFHFGLLRPRVSKAFERLTKVWFKFQIFPALIIYDRYNVAWYVIDMVPIMYVFVCMNVGNISCFAMIIMFSYVFVLNSIIGPFYMIQYWNVSIIWPERSFIGSGDSEDELQHDHVEYRSIQNKCTMPWTLGIIEAAFEWAAEQGNLDMAAGMAKLALEQQLYRW